MTEDRNLEPPNTDQIENDIDWSRVEMSSSADNSTKEVDFAPYNGRDGLLHYFNRLAYDGFNLGVTVYVNGLTVSGRIISGPEYLAGLEGLFTGFEQGTWGEYIRGDIERTKAYDERLKDRPDYARELNFLHLKDARVFTPGKLGLPSNGSYMRLKVDSIDGWSHGLLEEGDSNG